MPNQDTTGPTRNPSGSNGASKKFMRETDARILIDRRLREADWDIENKNQVSTEETSQNGRADYILKDSRGRAIAVIEAKRFLLIRLPPNNRLFHTQNPSMPVLFSYQTAKRFTFGTINIGRNKKLPLFLAT